MNEESKFPIMEERIMDDVFAEEKTGWIPVTERLPEKNGLYMVTYINGVADIDTAFLQNGNWYGCTEDGIQDEYWHKVIAWQSLPEPYHPEEGQE